MQSFTVYINLHTVLSIFRGGWKIPSFTHCEKEVRKKGDSSMEKKKKERSQRKRHHTYIILLTYNSIKRFPQSLSAVFSYKESKGVEEKVCL